MMIEGFLYALGNSYMAHFLISECSAYAIPVLDDRLGVDELNDTRRCTVVDASLTVGPRDGLI